MAWSSHYLAQTSKSSRGLLVARGVRAGKYTIRYPKLTREPGEVSKERSVPWRARADTRP